MKAQRSMVNVSTGVDGEWQCGVAIVDGGRQRGDRRAALFSTGVVLLLLYHYFFVCSLVLHHMSVLYIRIFLREYRNWMLCLSIFKWACR